MKHFKQKCAVLLLAASLLGGTSVWAADHEEPLLSSTGQWMNNVSGFAGSGAFSNANGSSESASFRMPQSVAVLPDGSVIVADSDNQLLRKVDDGQVTTYAGITFSADDQGIPIGALQDGPADKSLFNSPAGLAVDQAGNVYVADADNHAIRKVAVDGEVTTLAGDGTIGNEDGTGAEAHFYSPQDVAVAQDGTVYVADTLNHLIRKISAQGEVSTLNEQASRPVEVAPGVVEIAGDYRDGKLSEALFNEPTGLALDAKGNLYVSDSGNQRIRYIDFSTNTVSTVAGGVVAADNESIYEDGQLYAQGDFADGDAAEAKFDFPRGLAVSATGGLLIADSMNHSIRYLHDGVVSTVAGDVDQENGNTNGIDRAAMFQNPADVIELADGTLLVADQFNGQIRQIASYRLPLDLPTNQQVKVVHNREVIHFPDALPVLTNDRTMVPVNAIATALGYTVTWQSEGQIVRLVKGDLTIQLVIGETQISNLVKGEQPILREMDVAPYIMHDRTYVPVRFFAEEIGLDVQWVQSRLTAVLRDKAIEG